jgi:hypothetical protein
MTEQLKHSTIDQYSHKPETDTDNKNKIRLNRKGRLVRAGGLAVSATLLTGAAAIGVDNIFSERQVGNPVVETIDGGETPIDTVTDGAHRIAQENNLNFNAIHDIVYAGQEVAGELGQPVQAGTKIEVTVVENGLGQRSVKADPATPGNLAHLDK